MMSEISLFSNYGSQILTHVWWETGQSKLRYLNLFTVTDNFIGIAFSLS